MNSRWRRLVCAASEAASVTGATSVFFILGGTNSHDTCVYSMWLLNGIILWQCLFTVFRVNNQKECGDKWLNFALHHVQTSLICCCALTEVTGLLLLQVLNRTRQTTHSTWYNPESPGKQKTHWTQMAEHVQKEGFFLHSVYFSSSVFVSCHSPSWYPQTVLPIPGTWLPVSCYLHLFLPAYCGASITSWQTRTRVYSHAAQISVRSVHVAV